MRIIIKTPIAQNYIKVMTSFDEKLFKMLTPAFTKLSIKRFDGNQKGHEVHLEITTLGQTHHWVSVIVENQQNALETFFVDEGKILPRPLSFWRHTHKVLKVQEESCLIIDDIVFETKPKLLAPFIYPLLFFQFLARKPIYKRYFKS